MAVLVAILIVAIIGGMLIRQRLRRERERQRAEIVRQNAEYGMLRDMYEKANHEYQLLQTDFGALRREKEEEIESMRAQMKAYMDDDIKNDQNEKNNELSKTDICKVMRMMARTGEIPTNSQLNEMEEQIDSESPEFYKFITDVNYALSRQEILYFTCLGGHNALCTGEMRVLGFIFAQL